MKHGISFQQPGAAGAVTGKNIPNRGHETVPIFRLLMVLLSIITLLELMTGAGLQAGELTARQIMEQVESRDTFVNRSHDMTMTLTDQNGSVQTRQFSVFSKQDKEVKRKIMFVTSPPKLKQTGFLTFEYLDKEKEDDQWIYLPSMGKHKRIAAADRNDSFMGSDLNYSDLNSKQVDDYRYCILKETTVGKTDVWLIESLPKSVSVIEQTGYLKAILAIQKTNYAILRVMAWSSDGKTVKIQDFSDFICIDKVWIPRDILVASRVGNVTRHTTRLRIDNIRLDPDLPDDLFTVRSLEKGFSR